MTIFSYTTVGDTFLPHSATSIIVSRENKFLPIIKYVDPPNKEIICRIPALDEALSVKEKQIFMKASQDLPCELIKHITEIKIIYNKNGPRAMSGSTMLYFRDDFFTLAEAESVLIHELGHIIDLGGLNSEDYSKKTAFYDGDMPIFADDPSMLFYQISWQDSHTWKKGSIRQNFVSGYAATDAFEDFAESLVMYVKQAEYFRALASKNPVLQKKYDFFREQIFAGQEFVTGEIPADLEKRVWDATKL